MMKRLLTLAGLFVTAVAVQADDWPQWMGPNRNNVWNETGIIDKFPSEGPKVLWRAKVAGGYAGPAVANGVVYATDYTSADQTADQLNNGNFDRKGSTGKESVKAFDEKTGKELWKYEYEVKYTISYPVGPRCTPVVHDGKLYTLGSEGHLACLDAKTGTIVWAKELKQEYKTKSALWGYAAHPIIDGKKLITLAGGDGSHVVALDKDTGNEIWKSQSQIEQGYSPVLITTINGVRQMIVAGPQAVRGLDPETGKRLWTTPYDATSRSIIMTPIVSGDYLFVGGYDNKNLIAKFKKSEAGVDIVVKDKKNYCMSPVNVQPFEENGIVYGVDGPGKTVAFDIKTGQRLWESDGPFKNAPQTGTAFIVKNGDRFVLFTETGELVLCKLNSKGYEELSRAKVIDETGAAFGRKIVWSQPAYANKHCYIRNDKELICVDMEKK